jgi:general secretion pathway protein A
MYKSHFRLARNPFDLTPDPTYFLSTKRHNEALAALHYGIRRHKGFVVVTGEVGTGKTLLLRCLLRLLKESKDVAYAYVFNSRLSPAEFLQYVLFDFGLPASGKNKGEMLLELGQFLVARGAKGLTTVLIIDEAHHLSEELLEEVRLLSNLETTDDKLLQIVLVGQPELDEKLDSPGLRQLKQRVALRAQLNPLNAEETKEYIEHRIRVATADGQRNDLFTAEAMTSIYRYSRGVPRLINTICENALILAYARQLPRMTVEVIEDVAREFRLNKAALPEEREREDRKWMEADRPARVLGDLYAVLRKPSTRGADATAPVTIETSEYEPNI